ncbi:FtsQ-type POTRA domain-containing protein [Melissococcus plutonius]|uniref:Cell division protein DivIB n=1 Tax=Melissococcus plutonius TaxID=33970 RepID=A0A2Z5Y3B0_9ENTE|nr:cell division protein FtsQ/DivIB [Melissococcus plutonius]MCV2498151.1 FtsQ-type POTRA domain-containing protein [Melissococcus plutonius]MCV2500928.1 FtsQ-type POTRA domain-containing protein [Melissococcus plutonius]MCV2504297.1 FtsQ-type POTRA domain-containing protein [Melissococcus plutonius]MCV2506766.1 FtsQ-type POTRA domain-containing protein [Melissococcus plutonius]MCV2527102.1 FtsQ-type POTRA domain-containing protein [Melissococcus plutonius]
MFIERGRKVISRRKKSKPVNKEYPNSSKKVEKQKLTPWQKENLDYLKKQGKEVAWKQSIIENTSMSEKSDKDESISIDDKSTSQSLLLTEKKQNTYELFVNRLPNVKKERHKRLYKRLLMIVSIFLFAILVITYFLSPLSRLSNISVKGNKNIETQQIVSQSKLKINDSLWKQFNDRKNYEKNIVQHSLRAKKATISLNGLNSFQIKIDEYKIMAIEERDNYYYPILENGKILPDKTTLSGNEKPILKNFDHSEETIKKVIGAYNQLPIESKKKIANIEYARSKVNKELLRLFMNDGNQVLINISELTKKLAYYSQVASQMNQSGVIDMEVGIFSYPFENKDQNNSNKNAIENSQPINEN